MTITIPHHKTQREVIGMIDQGAESLFAGAAGDGIEIVDQKKEWNGSTMTFSFGASMGFVSLPLSGTLTVDDTNVTVNMELPAMVKNFIGEDKIAGDIEEKIKGLLA